MIHNWCKSCERPSSRCLTIESHKKDFLWRADFLLGGRFGQRIRKYFGTKDEARVFESQMRTDFVRGKLFPYEMQSKIPFRQLADDWFNKYALIRIKNPYAELGHLDVLKDYFKDKPINQLRHEDGEGFIQMSVKRGKKVGAVNRDLHTLKSLLKWATENHYLLASPFIYLKQLKGEVSRVRWLAKEELSRLLEECSKSDPSLGDVILFGVLTGFRKGNLIRVTAQDINGDFITASKTKSGRPYDVAISPELRHLLDRLVKARPSGPLLDASNFQQRFQRIVKAAKLWIGGRDGNNITIHTLRHTFASYYLKNGGDLYKLQHMLGHSTVAMTQKYAHLCQRDMAKQAALLNFEITPKVELRIA